MEVLNTGSSIFDSENKCPVKAYVKFSKLFVDF